MTIRERSSKQPNVATVHEQKARSLVRDAFVQALSAIGLSQRACARAMGISPSTIGRWKKLKTPVDWELVLNMERLGPAFLNALCKHAPDWAPKPHRHRK
jgi:hypothetical protein